MSDAVLAASRSTFAGKARTFHWASLLLQPAVRDHAALVYAFCRLVDDTADEGGEPIAARAALDRLEGEVLGELPARPLIAAFREAAARLGIPLASAVQLIHGARSDLGPVRIPDDDALLRYCYRVASTVGLMMSPVFGVRNAAALPHAVDLGIAMQLTNIARDVREDAAMNRVYLPAARLARMGVEPEDLVGMAANPEAIAAVVSELLVLADRFYRSADDGMRDLPWRPRQAVLVASRVYRAIGVRLRRRGCDSLAGRTVVSLPGKVLWTLAGLAAGIKLQLRALGPRRPHAAHLHAALRGLPGAHA